MWLVDFMACQPVLGYVEVSLTIICNTKIFIILNSSIFPT